MEPVKEPKLYVKLRAEAKAPLRPLRWFVYVALGASGFIGAFIFLTQSIAGRDVESALPNFFLQIGDVALMIWLLRRDRPKAGG